jgi:hypothetical protein
MRDLLYHSSTPTVKTEAAGDGEAPAAVIANIGSRLRRSHSRAELRALRAAAARDFRTRRATFRAIGGLDYVGTLDDAPASIRDAYAALHVALTTMAAIDFALDPVDPVIAVADEGRRRSPRRPAAGNHTVKEDC